MPLLRLRKALLRQAGRDRVMAKALKAGHACNTPIEKIRDIPAKLKALRLHGMAVAWDKLMAQGGGATHHARQISDNEDLF